ncbi:MAG TPA: SRPBCC domain-containing protein [Streptosporangiaceae bacterium]|nr:SRPBCC domain-containing protein [Streptosporangiaceae bacterium]
MPGWTGAPQVAPARIVWRTELGQQLPGERKVRRRAQGGERGDLRSRVTFDIESVTQGVKLTMIHDGFEPGSIIVQMVRVGWPDVISSLKTLLETGEPLPA